MGCSCLQNQNNEIIFDSNKISQINNEYQKLEYQVSIKKNSKNVS